MNINSSDFKKGLKVLVDGEPYDIIECHFVKPGKGQALYKLKLRNLLKGTIIAPTYRSGDSLEAADVRKSNGQYLYRDGEGFVFMEDESFEQYTITTEKMGDAANFLLDGAKCELLFYNEQLIGVDPPAHVVVEVTYTEPAARGNTTANVTKAATVETGVEVQVPAFIDQGEKIKVDARTGDYIERAK
ncbi:MAG: elongation factor P [Planctomycetaceae bacterium]|jgi:elongation factor P|nr:elongation factor P [Planctomycetaceae bacterium]